MYKYQINTPCHHFESFILHIRDYFNQHENSIHKARNELKILTYENESLVVKSFKVPHFLRRMYYTFFRDTKAKKSYEHSLKLGIFTPKPIGYIEFYHNTLLLDSYFIAENFAYDFTIREPLLDAEFKNKTKILQAFAAFTFKLHEKGILHKDYSPGNILIRKEQGGYNFKVVDINRMVFKTLSLEERMKNFNKLWANNSDLEIIAGEYAALQQEEKQKCIDMAIAYNQKHKGKMILKNRLRGKRIE